mmetsp:Transcript_2699/g.12177  ORF Transcript_2699/g.12177 Transcript_2699/m.12177 type:complete len:259 (-) Transcript_2699:193-969(-)
MSREALTRRSAQSPQTRRSSRRTRGDHRGVVRGVEHDRYLPRDVPATEYADALVVPPNGRVIEVWIVTSSIRVKFPPLEDAHAPALAALLREEVTAHERELADLRDRLVQRRVRRALERHRCEQRGANLATTRRTPRRRGRVRLAAARPPDCDRVGPPWIDPSTVWVFHDPHRDQVFVGDDLGISIGAVSTSGVHVIGTNRIQSPPEPDPERLRLGVGRERVFHVDGVRHVVTQRVAVHRDALRRGHTRDRVVRCDVR